MFAVFELRKHKGRMPTNVNKHISMYISAKLLMCPHLCENSISLKLLIHFLLLLDDQESAYTGGKVNIQQLGKTIYSTGKPAL